MSLECYLIMQFLCIHDIHRRMLYLVALTYKISCRPIKTGYTERSLKALFGTQSSNWKKGFLKFLKWNITFLWQHFVNFRRRGSKMGWCIRSLGGSSMLLGIKSIQMQCCNTKYLKGKYCFSHFHINLSIFRLFQHLYPHENTILCLSHESRLISDKMLWQEWLSADYTLCHCDQCYNVPHRHSVLSTSVRGVVKGCDV